jgi:hypothetical protein
VILGALRAMVALKAEFLGCSSPKKMSSQ